jgi:cytoskeletal protein CcmA (bactofilin family)
MDEEVLWADGGEKKKFWHRLFTREERHVTLIAEGVSIDGAVDLGKGVVRLDGRMQGKVTGRGTLIMGARSLLQGELQVGKLILNGRREGVVHAGTVHIAPTGRLQGRISASHLVVDEGGVFDGQGRVPATVLPQDTQPL